VRCKFALALLPVRLRSASTWSDVLCLTIKCSQEGSSDTDLGSPLSQCRNMALQLDANALGAVTKLLDKVTDKRESHQDVAALEQLKSFCKQSDENIIWFSSVLLHRLKEEHAQVLLVPSTLTGSINSRCAKDSSLWQYLTCPNLCVMPASSPHAVTTALHPSCISPLRHATLHHLDFLPDCLCGCVVCDRLGCMWSTFRTSFFSAAKLSAII
jgi:hypothetical protein